MYLSVLNSDVYLLYKIIFIKGVCGTGKCLERNTLIFCKPNNETNFGYYKISELIGKEGKILSLDNNGNIEGLGLPCYLSTLSLMFYSCL